MAEVTCFHCKSSLIEIDRYGQRLVGCLNCNRWSSPGSSRVVELTKDEVWALRRMRRRSQRETAPGARPEAAQRSLDLTVFA